jgi:hypothetical protein
MTHWQAQAGTVPEPVTVGRAGGTAGCQAAARARRGHPGGPAGECECPKSELDNTEKRFPLRKTSEIKKQREAGRAPIAESMMTVLMIERHMLQMRLYNMLCNLLYTYLDILYNTEDVI